MEREQTTTTDRLAEAMWDRGETRFPPFAQKPWSEAAEEDKNLLREYVDAVRPLIVAEEHARLRELFDEIPTDQEIDGFPYERSAGEAMRDVLALLGASHDRR